MLSGSSYGIKADRTIWSWGNNLYGALGDGTTTNKSSPVMVVAGLTEYSDYIGVSAGFEHALGIVTKKQSNVWGLNSSGQLGNLSTTNRSTPRMLINDPNFWNWTQVSAGGNFSMGLLANGQAWAWGNNQQGQLGDLSMTDKSSPVLVVGSHSFTKVYAANTFAMGLKSNGQLWTWGDNTHGQLGNNSTDQRSSPVIVVGNHSFSQISGGYDIAIALKQNGAAWTWGNNQYGQLGDNTLSEKSSPVLVVGHHSFTSVSGGGFHFAALKSNGEVWTWGGNQYGQLGDGTNSDRSSPVLVVGNHSFVEVVAQYEHNIARKSNGEVWTWGKNTVGQLGDGTIVSKSSPVKVIGDHEFVAIYLWDATVLEVSINDSVSISESFSGVLTPVFDIDINMSQDVSVSDQLDMGHALRQYEIYVDNDEISLSDTDSMDSIRFGGPDDNPDKPVGTVVQ